MKSDPRFTQKGQKVDGKRVYLSEALVSEALEVTPKSFAMIGRNGGAGVRIDENQETTVVAPGNGTLFIQDFEGRRRRAMLSDFDNIVKLCENSRNVNLVGSWKNARQWSFQRRSIMRLKRISRRSKLIFSKVAHGNLLKKRERRLKKQKAKPETL